VVLRKDPGRGGLEFACRAEKENHQGLQSSSTENLYEAQRSLQTQQVSAADKANPKSAERTMVRTVYCRPAGNVIH
jgi:signal recognition particle subunit SEC65